MHPWHHPALVHPAFENAAPRPDTSARPADGCTAFLTDGSRPDTRYLA
jgi:hypothetical protein